MKVFVLTAIILIAPTVPENTDSGTPRTFTVPSIDVFASREDCLRTMQQWEDSSRSAEKDGISRRIIDRCSEHQLSGR